MHRWQLIPLAASFACCVAPVGLAADAGGLREIESRHLTLYTDLPADDEVDKLPAYFDQAFGQWCAYFGVDPAGHADWHVRGCLMRSPERFAAAGLLPPELPEFPNAYSLGDRLWMFDQTSVYYRRHLLLHEGTHSFMHTLLGSVGPPWYAEGTAELLATHRLQDGRVLLNVFPRDAGEVSKWGRIEIVQTAFADHRAKTLAKIFAYRGILHATVEPYGWCWAAAAFLDNHPRYRDRFRSLGRHVAATDFAAHVRDVLAPDAARLNEDWQLFVANLDYGYDFERMEVQRVPGKPLAPDGQTVSVAADRGWQSTGIALASGEQYRLGASGRYLVAGGDKGSPGEPWPCEPGGVTIAYHDGRPLGILLGAIRADAPRANRSSGLIRPLVIGLNRTLSVDRPGTLYLRINDSAGSLSDNAGEARVEITRQ